MNRGQVQLFLNKSRNAVVNYQERGYLTARMKGRMYVFDPDEVLEFALNPPPKVIFYIGKDAAEVIQRLKLILKDGKLKEEEVPKYTRKRFLKVYQGYDFLQFWGIARHYIIRKYQITTRQLDLILFLAPMNYFTSIDISYMPKSFGDMTIQALIKKGIIVRVSLPPAKQKMNKFYTEKGIYTLTKEKREAVEELYKILAQEEQIDLSVTAFKPDVAIDRKRVRLIKTMRQKSNPDNLKPLYEN